MFYMHFVVVHFICVESIVSDYGFCLVLRVYFEWICWEFVITFVFVCLKHKQKAHGNEIV